MVEVSPLRTGGNNSGSSSNRPSSSSEEDEEEECDPRGGAEKKKTAAPAPLPPLFEPPSQAPPYPAVDHHQEQKQQRQEDAQRRWKILCIVRTADVQSDETARQEKIQERVDEWMSGFMAKMRIRATEEEDQSKQDDGTGSFKDSGLDSLDLDLTDASSSSAATSYLPKSMSVSKNDVRKSRTKERRKHEQEQRKRIRARAKEERERERQLVLEGKVKLTKSHLQDPVLKVHRDLLEVERKASSSVSPNRKSSVRNARSPKPIRRKVSRSRKMATAAAVHFKWKEDVARKTKSEELGSVADAEACRPLASPTASSSSSRSVFGKEEEEIMEGLSDLNKTLEGDYEETVIANLIYDEANDNIRTVVEDEEEGKDPPEDVDQAERKRLLSLANPVKSAFEDAQGVDDLFRIAEIWVNPVDYEIG